MPVLAVGGDYGPRRVTHKARCFVQIGIGDRPATQLDGNHRLVIKR